MIELKKKSGGGGATTALDNLASVQINTDLLFDIDSAYNIGSPTKFVANGYFDKIYFFTTTEASITGSSDDLITKGNIVPSVDSVDRLGNSTHFFQYLYIDKIYFYPNNLSIQMYYSSGSVYLTQVQLVVDGIKLEYIRDSGLGYIFLDFRTSKTMRPKYDSAASLGTSSYYFKNGYFDELYLNATAILDGAVAGHIQFVGDFVPKTDDTEWIGEIGSPFKAIKGLVIKDTTDGKHYKVEVINGTVTATALD